jgi:hypothetical protein
MAVVINRKAPVPKAEQNILEAIQEWLHKNGKDILFLQHRESGKLYRVIGQQFNPNLTTLKPEKGPNIRVKLTEREAALYKPFWRE